MCLRDFAAGLALNAGGRITLGAPVVVLIWLRMVYSAVKAIIAGTKDNNPIKERSQSATGALDNYKDSMKTSSYMSVFCIIAILVASAIFIPLHYFQETQPKSIWVIDGHRPLAEFNITYDSLFEKQTWENVTMGSWSDCFKLEAPHDRLGFFEFWWDSVKDKPLEYLPILQESEQRVTVLSSFFCSFLPEVCSYMAPKVFSFRG